MSPENLCSSKKTKYPRRRFSEGQGAGQSDVEVPEGEAAGDADERYDHKKGKSMFLYNHFTLHPLAALFITTTTTRLLWEAF